MIKLAQPRAGVLLLQKALLQVKCSSEKGASLEDAC